MLPPRQLANSRELEERTMAKKKAKALKTFLVTYHQPAAAWKKMEKMTKAEGAAAMKSWMSWAKKCGSPLVEMGAPLSGGVRLDAATKSVPSKRRVSGYSVVQAPSRAGAKKLMTGHPHLSWANGCEIEVHEFMKMG
jgi:hypothetical protein